MSAVSDEEKAYILMHQYDGRDVATTTKSSSSATSSVPWYRQAAFVGCAALFAGVVIGRGLSPDARLESQIGREETMPCFCGGNETNALPVNLAAEERVEERVEEEIPEEPKVEREQRADAQEKFKEELREEYREERRERREHREHAPVASKREKEAEQKNEKAERGSKNEKIEKGPWRRRLPNIVSGLMDVELSPYETAHGVGNAKEAGICRDLAKGSKENYVAWAWSGASAPDAKLRETCLFYRQIKPFHGRPGDHNHVTGCTDFAGSPFTGCAKEDHDDSKTRGQSRTGSQSKRLEDSRKSDDENNHHHRSQNVDKSKPNAVHGLLAANIAFEIPLGMGKSTRARECREYAEDHHDEFVAFAHISSESKNEALRSTCLFYKEIVPFDGIPEESVVITACTDPGLSPVTGCKGKATTSFKREDGQASKSADIAKDERATSSKEETLRLTNPNIVRGLIGMDQVDFETPLGTGNARDPSFCRDYASDEAHPYRAWAWISNESEDEEMRQTCLFYATFKAFAGRDDDKVHLTGCADKSHSPAFACER